MKTKVTSTAKIPQSMTTEQPSKFTVKRKRVIVYIPLFNREGSAAVKEEDSSDEPPALHQNEELKDIVIKHEDSIDEKLLSIGTTSTMQNNTVDMNYTKQKDKASNYCDICKMSFAANSCCRQHNTPQLKGGKLKKRNIRPIVPYDVNYLNSYCQSCNYQAGNKDAYRVHLKEVHEAELNPRQKYRPRFKPQLNIIPDVDDPNYNCQSCNCQFPNKQHYRIHLKTVHKMKLEPLPKGRLRLKPRLDITPVIDDTNSICRSCNHQFANKQVYRKHLTNIHKMELHISNEYKPKPKPKPDVSPIVDDPNHCCRSCNYQFASRDTYRAHLKAIHRMDVKQLQNNKPSINPDSNISPIVDDPNCYCRSCNYHFITKQRYRKHLKNTHKMKLKPLPKGKLKQEAQPNISPIVDDPRHHCRSCNYQFATKQNYRRHLQAVHKMEMKSLLKGRVKLEPQPDISPIVDDPDHHCRSCNYRFSNKQNYQRHLSVIHKIPIEPLQGRRSKIDVHPNVSCVTDKFDYRCESCDSRFSSRNIYRHHLMHAHGMKLERLHKTRLRLKTKPSITPIVDDPNFNCRSCNYLFSSRKAYRYHLTHVHKMELPPLQRLKPGCKAKSNVAPSVNDSSDSLNITTDTFR